MNITRLRKGSRWSNQWVLVTGATSGIGRALAEELASVGAHLVVPGRRVHRLEVLVSELKSRRC